MDEKIIRGIHNRICMTGVYIAFLAIILIFAVNIEFLMVAVLCLVLQIAGIGLIIHDWGKLSSDEKVFQVILD